MRIYVAGPYSADTAQGRLDNTNTAMRAGVILINAGHVPFVPHLSHFTDEESFAYFKKRIAWEVWMEQDLVWVRQCEALLRLPGPSRGADIEVMEAHRIGIPVYYDIDEIPAPLVDEGLELEHPNGS